MISIRYCLVISLLFVISSGLASGDNWKDILENESGKVQCYWYPNNVVIENSLDIIDGIEHELMSSFVEYLSNKYEVKIELEWIKTESFGQVIDNIRNGSGGTFGASSISITEERKQYYNFTQPYLADVAVLVSNTNIPIALSENQLKEVLNGKKAISIQNTTLKSSLLKLGEDLNIDFTIDYVDNSGDIINRINDQPDNFGYVDIANFLVAIDQNTNIRRQFFYPVKLEGLAIIYPKNNDWLEPTEDYFTSTQFQKDRQRIITKYLGTNASEIIDRISMSADFGPLEEIVLSNREKEAQYEQLLEATQRDKESEQLNIILGSVIFIIIIVLALVYVLYRIKAKSTDSLLGQQKIIEETNEKLLSLNEEKNNLIQVLAHDLRSPLANILNGSQIIQSREEFTEEGEKILGFILDSSEKMRSLIDKILDVDAIEAGRHNVKNEVFEVSEVIQEVVNQNKRKAENKQINIAVNTAKGLNIKADKVYTGQVIENLLTNAIKYSAIASEVGITTESTKDMVKISVQDQGPGLTKDDEKKIFKKYQHLSATPTKGEESIGLGLSIVKLFTERMGGNVSYDTKIGEGTTFHVYLHKA